MLAACNGERARPPATDSTVAARCAPGPWGASSATRGRRAATLIQVGAFTDTVRALALRDSLERAGWTTVARRATPGGKPIMRVSLVPLQGPDLPRLVAFALRQQGHASVLVRDTIDVAVPTALVLPVNRGTHGMSAATRWTMSPDRCGMLVEEDPVSVEAEPLPNGFLFATDVGPLVVQRDSAWDVAPSPRWSALAYGKAYGVHAGERDSVMPAQWDSLAARLGMRSDSVRAGSFVSSGMAIAFGFAQPVVLDVSPGAGGTEGTKTTAQQPRVAGGWRVAWTASGDTLAIGAGPRMAQDDSPSPSWIALDAATLEPRGSLTPDKLATIRWSEGPVLDVSIPLDTVSAPPIEIDGFTIASTKGWISVGPSSGGRRRIVGPGIALAATKSGRFIAALVRWPDTGQYDQPARLVVYQVSE